MTEPITAEKAQAIARGEDGFDPEPQVVASTRLVNSWLKVGVLILTVTTIFASTVAIGLLIFRISERRASEAAIEVLTGEVSALRKTLTAAQEDLECARATNLTSDIAQAELITVGFEQFASVLDQLPPPADPGAITLAAAELRRTLTLRSETLSGC